LFRQTQLKNPAIIVDLPENGIALKTAIGEALGRNKPMQVLQVSVPMVVWESLCARVCHCQCV